MCVSEKGVWRFGCYAVKCCALWHHVQRQRLNPKP